MNDAGLEIALIVLGFLLSGAAALILWQYRDIRQMTQKTHEQHEARINALYDRLAQMRVEIGEGFVRKDEHWIDEARARRKLGEIKGILLQMQVRESDDE